MVIGAFEGEGAEDALEAFGAAAGRAGHGAAGAGASGTGMVRGVGVEALFEGAGRHAQHAAPEGHLHRLEIEALAGARAYEGFDFLGDLSLEGGVEAPFLAAGAAVSGASSWASAQPSQASQ